MDGESPQGLKGRPVGAVSASLKRRPDTKPVLQCFGTTQACRPRIDNYSVDSCQLFSFTLKE
jgi:hypothetical protein